MAVNIVVLEHSRAPKLLIVRGCFGATGAELSRCDREHACDVQALKRFVSSSSQKLLIPIYTIC